MRKKETGLKAFCFWSFFLSERGFPSFPTLRT
nr:MAG TPA: hypothetical protein [Caudoviricetes sp.]DAH61197.1 MAG TPA: hypothetical protein [Caudoviricetes sp.]